MHTLLFIISLIAVKSPNVDSSIIVTISGIDKTTGIIRASLFDNESDFLYHSLERKNVDVYSKEITITFKDIPEGRFALSVYHDQNSNGKLDSNFLKIPKEPYGFSNNPSTMFGPPDFTEASFDHKSKKVTYVNIKLK